VKPPSPLVLRSVLHAALLLLCAFPPAPAAPPSSGAAPGTPGAVLEAELPVTRESYTLPSGARLVMEVPVPWQVVYVRADDTAAPSLYFTPVKGHGFELIVSVYEAPGRVPLGPERVHDLVERAGREALRLAPDQALRIRPWPGAVGGAFIFELEDEGAEAGPGSYPLLVQGAAALADRVLVFTLLGGIDGQERTETLRMLQSARLFISRDGH
jgi:hypothetical protein